MFTVVRYYTTLLKYEMANYLRFKTLSNVQ